MRAPRPTRSARSLLDRFRTTSGRRYAFAGATAVSSILNRGTSLSVSILTIRLTYQYLGGERYGMWITITSLVVALAIADLGMGSSVVSIVARALALRDDQAVKEIVASAFWMLSAVAVLALTGMVVLYPHINPARLFNVHSELATKEAGPTLLVVFSCFLLSLPFGAVRGALIGMQRGFVNSIWNMSGSIVSLLAVIAAIRSHAGLPLLALSVAFPPVLASAINAFLLFFVSHPELRPHFADASKVMALRILRTSIMFLLIQLSYTIGMQIDNIVIAQIMGARAVTEYAVPAKMYNIILSLLIVLSGSLWPAYTDALTRNDRVWIVRAFRRVVLLGVVIALISSVLLYASADRILMVWVGPGIHASRPFLAVLGISCVAAAYLQPVGFLLNGLTRYRAQVICGLAMAVTNLILSIALVKVYGIIGAILGTAISTIVAQVIPLTLVIRRLLKYDLNPSVARDVGAGPGA